LEWPRDRVGERLRFEDATTSTVFRETVLGEVTREPALLVVRFRRVDREHAPLAGFPGFQLLRLVSAAGTVQYRVVAGAFARFLVGGRLPSHLGCLPLAY
jgi:hypothetical protein